MNKRRTILTIIECTVLTIIFLFALCGVMHSSSFGTPFALLLGTRLLIATNVHMGIFLVPYKTILIK